VQVTGDDARHLLAEERPLGTATRSGSGRSNDAHARPPRAVRACPGPMRRTRSGVGPHPLRVVRLSPRRRSTSSSKRPGGTDPDGQGWSQSSLQRSIASCPLIGGLGSGARGGDALGQGRGHGAVRPRRLLDEHRHPGAVGSPAAEGSRGACHQDRAAPRGGPAGGDRHARAGAALPRHGRGALLHGLRRGHSLRWFKSNGAKLRAMVGV
jgi:hypothetical protein